MRTDVTAFGRTLRDLRTQRNLTLRDLASRAKVSFTYLSKLENGRLEYTPSEVTIRKLAQELGVEVLDLLDKAGKAPPELAPVLRTGLGRKFFRVLSERDLTTEDWNTLLTYLGGRTRVRKKGKN